MSKERELLKECRLILDTPFNGSTGISLRNRIAELLAQPEQPEPEPVAWIDAKNLKSLQESTGYALRFLTNDTENLNVDDVPLYLAPPKRERITDEEIYNHCCAMDNSYTCNFIDGVEWAEHQHGIRSFDE